MDDKDKPEELESGSFIDDDDYSDDDDQVSQSDDDDVNLKV